ncbi:phage protein U [Ancylobacter sp. 3268]|uniref:phage tail protein n=1 Tax=Ancylobacter sp. 3268 TaxID=2817752 RepID=UPI002859FD1B|nr:phage tail protein [Ancylobacter sp. 3268]MDR6954114.1 phage protein U [Ancylobacter sp. 3268]
MLMAWGPFRFTVPNYSVESIRRSLQPRVEPQPVIGAMPSIHRLGPANEAISLESTFHPRHLNGRGLAQLAGVRLAVNRLTPMQLVHFNGAGINIFGLWIAVSLDSEETMLDTRGTPQMVSAHLSMIQYGGSEARAIAEIAVLGTMGFDTSGLSVSTSITYGTGGVGVSASAGALNLSAGIGL